MILGYVDASDRLYDVGFATLKMKMRVESSGGSEKVLFSKASGEGQVAFRVRASAGVTASLGMDHKGETVPLLRPVEGRAYRHDEGLLFVAAPKTRDPDEPGYFLVQVRAMPSALKFFFEDQEGTEFISIPNDEILRIEPGPSATRLFVSAASVALPKEEIAYMFELTPPASAAPLLEGLPMSR